MHIVSVRVLKELLQEFMKDN